MRMTATAPILAKSWDFIQDPTGWMLSEKLDGIRAIWDGEKFMSREGNPIVAPDWFVVDLPKCRLDGELWMGRGTFDTLVSRLQTKGGDWSGVKFMVFDLAQLRKNTLQRIGELHEIELPDHCELVPHVTVTAEQLDEMEQRIVDGGGEGVCLRQKWEDYRPTNFIKVKRLFPDLDRWQG